MPTMAKCKVCGINFARKDGERHLLCKLHNTERLQKDEPDTRVIKKQKVQRPLSDFNVSALKQLIKQKGQGLQGRSMEPVEQAKALLTVDAMQKNAHLSFNQALNAAAAAHVASPTTLRSLHASFTDSGELTPPSTEHRGRGNPFHPLNARFDSGPTLEAEQLIHRSLETVKLDNVFESCTTLCGRLRNELKIDVCKSTMHNWVTQIGYKYGFKYFINAQTHSLRQALIRKFIREYARAVKLEDEGTAVIVYMDESYIHSHHCTKQLWYSQASPTKNEVRGDDRGKRIIIVHAMTKDGMLQLPDVEPSNILTEEYHSCALIFDEVCADGVTPADYHDTINGEKFIGWMRNRLIPTFKQLYPDKVTYLILDNAKYHHHRGPDWITPSNMKRGALADFLRQRGVPNITLEDGRVIPRNKFSADVRGRNGGGPTLVQLKTAVADHIKAHPDINQTVPQQLMNDQHFELIYTPPYVSQLQPIELTWAFTKSLVARQSHRTRTPHQTTVQMREAMDKVTAEQCEKWVKKCHRWIDEFIAGPTAGSLEQFGNFRALIDSLNDDEDEAEPIEVDEEASADEAMED